MKYLRRFEKFDGSMPKVGDYVICEEEIDGYNFLKNFIGQVERIEERFYYVLYDINELPDDSGFRTYGKIGLRPMKIDEILYWGTMEDMKEYIIKIKSDKYNL
jgi:hypothetical protein